MATPSGSPATGGLSGGDFELTLNGVPTGGTIIVTFYGYKAAGSCPALTPTVGFHTATLGTVSLDHTKQGVAAFGDTNGNSVRIAGFVSIPIIAGGDVVLTIPGSLCDSASAMAQAYTEALTYSSSWENSGTGTARSSGTGSISGKGVVLCGSYGDGSGNVTYTATSGDTIDAHFDDTSNNTQTLQRRNMASSGTVTPALVVTSDQSSGWMTIAATYLEASPDATVQPTGLSATVSRGTPTVALVSNPTVQPTGFSLGVSRGTPTAGTTQSPTVPPNGLSTTALLGIPTVVRAGSPTVNPTGFGLSAILGTDTISIVANPTVQPTGYGLTVSRGTFTTESDVLIKDIPGFSLTTTLGTSSITRSPVAQPTGYSLSTSLGTPTVLLTQRLTPAGLSVSTTLGAPSIALEPTMTPTGLSVGIGLGSVSISTNASITQIPQGLPMPAMLGAPTIVVDNNPIIRPIGFGLSADFGTSSVALSPTMLPGGFALLAQLGHPQLGGEIATAHGALTGRVRVFPRLTGRIRLYPTD